MKVMLLSSFSLLLVAANVSAQDPEVPVGPPILLERAQLIEEREGDLAAAEKAYRDLLADPAAVAVHDRAALRLGALLWRLDRRDEAEPLLQRAAQADESLAALAAAVRAEDAAAAHQQQEREQRARALVERMVELCYEEPGEVDGQIRHITQQMASLPEATAKVLVQWLHENRKGVWVNGPIGKIEERILTSLLTTLWSVGTPPAADYLTAMALGDDLPWQRFVTTVAATRVRASNQLLVAVDAFTRTPDPTREVQANIESVLAIQPYDRVLQFMLAENPDTALVGLKALNRVATNADGQRALSEHGNQLVSWATGDSTEFADAAIRFLFDRQAASLLLKVVRARPDRAPEIRNNNWYLSDAGDLISELAQTAQVLGPYPLHEQPTTAQLLVARLLVNLQMRPNPAAVPAAIALATSHYGIDDKSCNWLQSTCSVADTSQRSQILRTIPVLGHPSAIAARLAARTATAELFAPIRDTVAAIAADPAKRTSTTWGETVGALIQLAARTGHPESTAWIRDQLDAWPSEVDAIMLALLTCSQVHTDEAALDGLRRILLMPELKNTHRGVVFGELVRRGDVATIAIMSEAMQLGMSANEPFRTGALTEGTERDAIADAYEAFQKQCAGVYVNSAVEFLADRVGRQNFNKRWHGYDDQHLIVAWRGLLTGPAASTVWSWLTSSDFPLSRCLLPLLAEQLSSHDYKGTIVLKCLGETLGSLTPSAVEDHPELRDAVHTLLGLDPATAHSTFGFLAPDTAQLFANAVRERLRTTGEVGWIARLSEKQIPVSVDDWTNALRTPDAYAILGALPPGAPAELETQVSALLRAANPMTRSAAMHAMARAFPQRAAAALLPMLQDTDENVRKTAREQLDLLREAQEQRQFWARVQGGVDLTPQATSQKLVQQAQPDQPSAQRVLAIRSLAAVGATEALPLLIEWSKDTDTAVKDAANAALAAILQKAEASK